MASGPYPDPRRGTWSVQWFNGLKWCRVVVAKRPAGWRKGDPMPKKPPPEAYAELAVYIKKEREARARKAPTLERSVADFLGAYREAYALTQDPNSVLALDKAIKVFVGWCEVRKITKVSDVTTAACHSWIADQVATIAKVSGKPLQRATIIQRRALLMAAWSQALLREEIEKNPWAKAQVPGKRARKKRGSWEPDEFDRLAAACKPWLRDLLTLGCHTGLRITALRNLEWGDIRWSKPGEKGLGFVVVRPEWDKAGVGYEVPMSEKCHDLLARKFLDRRTDSNYVLTTHGGKQITRTNISHKAIVAASIRAGLIPKEGGKVDSPNHRMRRSFGRWAVQGHLTGDPIPVYIVSRWLGHASIAMTQEYLDLSEFDSVRFMTRKEG